MGALRGEDQLRWAFWTTADTQLRLEEMSGDWDDVTVGIKWEGGNKSGGLQSALGKETDYC